MKNWLKNIFLGITWGCTILVMVLCVMVLLDEDGRLVMGGSFFLTSVGWSILIGLGFNLPTVIYDRQDLPRWAQTLIHLGTGFLVFFLAAWRARWIPLGQGAGPLLLFIAIALATGVLIWLGFCLYYRWEARRINAKLREKQAQP